MNATEATTFTAANGTVFEAETHNCCLGHTARHNTPIYGDVHGVVSHPFTEGSKVRIGKGTTTWRVYFTGNDVVSVTNGKQYRSFAFDQIARLSLIG
jgi:hypothetical protein